MSGSMGRTGCWMKEIPGDMHLNARTLLTSPRCPSCKPLPRVDTTKGGCVGFTVDLALFFELDETSVGLITVNLCQGRVLVVVLHKVEMGDIHCMLLLPLVGQLTIQ